MGQVRKFSKQDTVREQKFNEPLIASS